MKDFFVTNVTVAITYNNIRTFIWGNTPNASGACPSREMLMTSKQYTTRLLKLSKNQVLTLFAATGILYIVILGGMS